MTLGESLTLYTRTSAWFCSRFLTSSGSFPFLGLFLLICRFELLACLTSFLAGLRSQAGKAGETVQSRTALRFSRRTRSEQAGRSPEASRGSGGLGPLILTVRRRVLGLLVKSGSCLMWPRWRQHLCEGK